MLRIGTAQVQEIAAGRGIPSLNATTLPQMIAMRPEWDHDAGNVESWLDSVAVTDEAALIESLDPAGIPELAGSWDKMDETARRFVQRLIGNCRSLHEQLSAVAALAERLQEECSGLHSATRG